MLRIPPALALFLLSPMIGELLSGSAPPTEFFSPFAFLIIVSLYGSGAVLVREAVRRQHRGVRSVLLLGAAYGIVEEGLMVKSFFDPNWPDLGVLAVYGRWMGVNWVWAEMLTIYHAVFSITIPIALTELIYHERSKEAWVGQATLRFVALLFSGIVLFGFAVLTPYQPPPIPYVSSLVLALLLGYAGLRTTLLQKPSSPSKSLGLRRFWAAGLLATLAFFLSMYALPFLNPWPVVTMVIGFLPFMLVKRLVDGRAGIEGSAVRRFGLASGALTFLILLTPIQELDSTRTDNPAGMSLVGLAFLVFLVWIRVRLKGQSSVAKSALASTDAIPYAHKRVAWTPSVVLGNPLDAGLR